jgi:hypothetical protein
MTASRGDVLTGLGWWSPAYGRLEPTTTLRVTQAGVVPFWIVSVFDLDSQNAVTAIDFTPIISPAAGTLEHQTAVRITRTTSVDHVIFAEPSASPAPLHAAIATNRNLKQRSTSTPSTRVAWRAGGVETDARMAYFRRIDDGAVNCLAAVGATYFRPDPDRAGDDHEDRTCVESRVS